MEQLNLFSQIDAAISKKDNEQFIECLFNGERGVHSYSDMRISKSQYESTRCIQDEAYKKYIGLTVGDFEVLSIEYDWGTHKQVWTVHCNICGEITYKTDGYQWSRGKMYSTKCKKCKIREKEEHLQRLDAEKAIQKQHAEDELNAKINAELNKKYGKFEVIEYKGRDSCKVKCTECGAVRTNGVLISKLQQGIYPKCDCSKPQYGDEKWIGVRVGHLITVSHEGHYFTCRCDCGRSRICNDTFFARKRYDYCGDPKCEFISEQRSKAISARIRGVTYEGIAEALLKANGYKTKIVGKTGDYGVDIIATDWNGIKIAVQCKSNMKDTTGLDAVQQVYAGGRYYGLEHFAVISHSEYSVQATKMAKKLGVYLSDGRSFEYPDDMKKYVNELIPTYNAVKNTKAQKLYEMNGKKKTLANWAFEYGVNEENVRAGIKRGLTLENALKYTPRGKEKYTVRGVTGTFTELCKYFKPEVSTQTIRDRIKRGMSMEEAMFLPPSVPGRPKKTI